MDPYLTHGFLGAPESSTQMASQLVKPYLHSSPQSVIGHAWTCFPPKNCTFAWGDLDPHLTHDS